MNPDGTIEQGNTNIKNSENINFDLKYEIFPTAKELFVAGSCDSLKEATTSVNAVLKSIKSSGKTKTKKPPEFVWSLA